MKERILIYFTVLLMVVSTAYLAFIAQKQSDYSYRNNWWVVYFNDPRSEKVDFTVENYSGAKEFRWEAKSDNKEITSGSFKLEKGEMKNIGISTTNISGKITIEVRAGDNSREIYRKL